MAAPSPADAPVTKAVLPSSLKRSRIKLLAARFQSRSRLTELGLHVHHAKLTIFFLAMRRHRPQEADAVSGRGNVGMIPARHEHSVAIAHDGRQLRLLGVGVHE